MYWIIVQAILFALILFVPTEPQYTPGAGLTNIALGATVIGALVLLFAAYDLRKSLAIAPKPKRSGVLQTGGIYSYVRHPMYLAVWLILGSSVVRSGSCIKYVLFGALVIFFAVKTRHEEKLLREKYPGYAEHMERVGAYFPKIFKNLKIRAGKMY